MHSAAHLRGTRLQASSGYGCRRLKEKEGDIVTDGFMIDSNRYARDRFGGKRNIVGECSALRGDITSLGSGGTA